MKTTLFCFGLAGLTATTLALTSPAYGQSGVPQPPYQIDDPTGTQSSLTPAMLAAAAASGLSLLFRFVPGAREWFDQLTPIQKQWCMFGLTTVIALAIGLWNMAANAQGVTCDTVARLLFAIFAALTSNQVTYQFIKL